MNEDKTENIEMTVTSGGGNKVLPKHLPDESEGWKLFKSQSQSMQFVETDDGDDHGIDVEGVDVEKIGVVMSSTGCTKKIAINALRKTSNNVANALIKVSDDACTDEGPVDE